MNAHFNRLAVVHELQRLFKVAVLEVQLRRNQPHGGVLRSRLVGEKLLELTKHGLFGVVASCLRL